MHRISPPNVLRAEPTDPPPEMSSPKPPSEWRAGGERLREQLRRLRGRVEERLHELIGTIDQNLFEPLQSAAHEAAAVHEALAKTSRFDDPVDALSPDLRWSRVRDYRRDTMTRVIAPLRKRLTSLDIGTALNEHWHVFWEDMAALPPRLPVSITRAEPDTLYALSPEDGLTAVFHKRFVQMRRHFQIGPQPTSDGQFYAQEVPLRSLAAYHLRVRLPQLFVDHERAIYQHLARVVAAFERAATTWTHRTLDAERHLDHADHHRPALTTTSPSPNEATPSPQTPLMPADAWAAVDAEAKALDKQLRTLSGLRIGDRPARVQATARDAWSDLEADVEQAGSFLITRKDRSIPATSPPAPHHGDTATHWSDWHRQATDRLAFCEALAALHDTTYEQQKALLDALAGAGLDPVVTRHADVADTLNTLQDEVNTLFDDPPPPSALATRLRELRDRAMHLAEEELVAPLQTARLPHCLRETLSDHLAQLERILDPDTSPFHLHALAPPAAEVITPEADTREVHLPSIAREHFDAFFADAMRDALQPFSQRIEDVVRESENVRTILHFNFGAALDELTTQDDVNAVHAARELALNGLTRSGEALDTQVEHARAALPALTSSVTDVFATTWTNLHDRARTEGRIREHLLELRALVAREQQEATQQAERRLRAARSRLRRVVKRGRNHTEELVQKGRSAVGTKPLNEAPLLETLEALANTEQILAGLPLVYRRLFSPQPITDPSLLVGRDADLAHARRYIDQWKQGLTNAMVVTGQPGGGRTSFLNVVQKTMLQDAEVHSIKLTDRLASETDFAEHVVRALDLSLSTRGDQSLTLEHVRTHLMSRPRPEQPRVCLVGPLEHLFLRTVNRTELVGRILTFMSRTDSRILWLATVSEQGWQLLNATTSTATNLVVPHRLTPLDRPALETLILTRHRRSGLPLVFEPPEEPSPLLRRRLRQARTHERTQAVLQSAYFDRLHAHCGSNLVLALFYWFRSVRLDETPLVMRAHPIDPLDFDFLERLSMPQSFLLKALLDHATLTVDEYAEAAQVTPDTSLSLFESLANMLLLQPAETPHAGTPSVPVEPGRRYRIRPLVVHPVVKSLRGKNILH